MDFTWVTDYRELEEHLHFLEWNLNKSKLELMRWVSGDLADVKLNKNSRSSYLEENIQKIEQEIDLLEQQKKEMRLLFDSFTGVENKIVKMKYIDGMILEEIAETLGYSDSYIRKKHAGIRNTLQFIKEYESRKNRK
ncbi:hypothetical protein ACX1Q6_000379 [Enterococcus hirae]|nr:hypothetical protein [Enterococcus hirae]HAQ5024419.1 hypothetical protein [Enterococcus faecium]